MSDDAEDQLKILREGVAIYRQKYMRNAYLISREITGRSGMMEDIPDIDTLQRSRTFFEEMNRALKEAERAAAEQAAAANAAGPKIRALPSAD